MYSMDPWAILNTQEIWAQPSLPKSSTSVTCVMTATHVDSRATAGPNIQFSPSPPPLSAFPALPSTDGPYTQPLTILFQPNTIVLSMETGQNEKKKPKGNAY